MEQSYGKSSKEYEKAQLVSQENVVDVPTANEARNMICQLHFFLFNMT
jgi:hypothetical protein